MNPEFPQFERPVESRDEKRREKELNDRISEIQLYYVDGKFAKADQGAGGTFAEVLERETFLLNGVASALHALEKRGETAGGDQVMVALKKDIDAIHARAGQDWRRDVLARIDDEMERLKPMLRPEPPVEKRRAGLLNYNAKDRMEGLERYGIRPQDECLEIHFEEAYKQPNADIGPRAVQDSFARLAEVIVDELPQTRAVVGRSWLIDHPLGRRLGFTVVKEREHGARGPATWLQFIDKNGQIDRRKLERLIETGEPPYKERSGVIPVEEFLRMYLPAERRGKEIALKEVSSEWSERHERLAAAAKTFKEEWPSVSAEDIPAWLDRHIEVRGVLESAGVKDEYVRALVVAKGKGYDWQEMRENDPGTFNKIDEAVNAKVNEGKYVEKRVVF
jgi:hypothetical protein